ncbi:MAG: hypothetical protein ACPLPT_08270 [Moorellales bacterium]
MRARWTPWLFALAAGALALAYLLWWCRPEPGVPVQGMAVGAGSTAPFNTIYRFYNALAANDWETARSYCTPALWDYLRQSGQLRQWQERRRQDPSLAFSLFLVRAFDVKQEKGTAWALGEAQWKGGVGRPPNTVQTVFLEWADEKWRVARIDSRSAAEITAEFYQAINDGDWLTMRRLTEPQYWSLLVSRGILSALQQDWAQAVKGVYLVLHIRDLIQGQEHAWVQADVLWRPLTWAERETAVTVELVKAKEGWLVTRIYGHWEEAK